MGIIWDALYMLCKITHIKPIFCSPTHKQFSNIRVSEQSLDDWYCLLRNVQGELKPYINGSIQHLIDSQDFIKDSLFCEWGYIINLDDNVLEVWRGFQKEPQNNRYSINVDEVKKDLIIQKESMNTIIVNLSKHFH